MYCSNCGNAVADGDRFCGACGTPVAASAAPEQADQQSNRTPTWSEVELDVAHGGAARRVRDELPDATNAPDLHAGFWRRFAAYVLDAMIGAVLGFIAGFMLGVVEVVLFRTYYRGTGYLLGLIISWLYYALCESSGWQATPGKLALGLRVTDLDGRRIGFGRASGRFFMKIVSGILLFVGYMMAGWTARKQALHDMVAGCCVVRRDGLERIERGAPLSPGASAAGMPGWAIALIVVGACCFLIVPILAAIAIPAYQNYLVRAQVAEGMVLAGNAENAVVQHVSRDGTLPTDNAAAGLADPYAIKGRYVTSVRIDNGIVSVTFGNRANLAIANDHLVFQPYGSSNAMQWRCGSPDIQAKYLPLACRERSDAVSTD